MCSNPVSLISLMAMLKLSLASLKLISSAISMSEISFSRNLYGNYGLRSANPSCLHMMYNVLRRSSRTPCTRSTLTSSRKQRGFHFHGSNQVTKLLPQLTQLVERRMLQNSFKCCLSIVGMLANHQVLIFCHKCGAAI